MVPALSWWCHSSLAWLPGAGSSGAWLRYALGTSRSATQGPMGGCGAAVRLRSRPKSPIPPPTSPPRCTLARAASHSTCGRRIWRCMRGRASRCEPWLRATSRLSWPRAAAWSKTARLGSGRARPPAARGARGPRRPRARPRARVWRLSGLQSRPTAAWAARSEPWSPIQGAAQDAGCTDPSGARPRCA